MKRNPLNDMLLQSLQQERSRIEVYETALSCTPTEALREEWNRNLAQSRTQERMLCDVCDALDVDTEGSSSSRTIVREISSLLVDAMQEARAKGNTDVAERVACKCVLLAETKDYLDWGILDQARHGKARGPARRRTVVCLGERRQRLA